MGEPHPIQAGLTGMDSATVAAVIAALALVMNLVAHFLSGGWKLGTRISEVESNLRRAISEAKDEIEERNDIVRREFGEAIAAIRQKVHEAELYASQNYVRRDSFYQVKAELSSEIKSLGDKIDAKFARMEERMDRKPAAE